MLYETEILSSTEVIQDYFREIALYREVESKLDEYERHTKKPLLIEFNEKINILKKESDEIKILLSASVPPLALLKEVLSCIKADAKRAKTFFSPNIYIDNFIKPLHFRVLISLIFLMLIFYNPPIAIIIFILFYGMLRRNVPFKNYFHKLKLKLIDYEAKIEALEKQQAEFIENCREKTINELELLERKIQVLLDRNKEELTERGLSKLKLGENVELEPITSLCGIKSREKLESSLLKYNSHEDLDFLNRELLIREDDFYYQDRCLDRRTRFGIYEFCSIFITHNLLAYYRCYWNFVRQAPVDEETCVYLYDTIVSVHTYERASLNQKDTSTVRNYGGWLTINTTDGKKITIKISDDKKRKTDSAKSSSESKVDRVAEGIRGWLKKKRVDIIRTKPMN